MAVMEEIVRRDIMETLEQAVFSLKEADAFRVKELSNTVIHNASIFQDEDSLSVAVLLYALSKTMERGRIDLAGISQIIARAKSALQTFNIDEFRLANKMALRKISETDSRLKLFVNSVIEQAQLRKGSRICMHGVSVARTASILGISRWELMQYLGRTGFHEDMPETVNSASRLALAMKVFG